MAIERGGMLLDETTGDFVGFKTPGTGKDVYVPRFSTDASGAVTGLVGPDGAITPTTPPSYTWAAANVAMSAFVDGQIVRITDYGNGGSLWRYDETAGCLRTVGKQTLYSAAGSIAAPISTVHDTSGTLIDSLLIPAGMLRAGAEILLDARFHRRGANGTCSLELRLGTTDSSSDAPIRIITVPATDLRDDFLSVSSVFYSLTGFNTTNFVTPNSNGTFGDRTTNVNAAADMYINAFISSANASDYFDLINYRVVLEV